MENSIRVGSVGRGYFETRWPQFVPPESADQAIAKVSPFPAPTDCKSVDECVPRDGLKEVRATLEVDSAALISSQRGDERASKGPQPLPRFGLRIGPGLLVGTWA